MERQQAVCSRCLRRGHRVAECQNDVTCRACGMSGHKRGDPTCSGERAVNNQPIGEGGVVGWWWGWWWWRGGESLAAPKGKWSSTFPQSGTSPLMLQTPGNPSVRAPPRQRERRPGERRCHPTRNMTGRSARKSGRGSEQDHQHLSSLLRQTTDGQTKQDYVRRGRDLSKTHDKKSKKPKAIKQTRMSLSTERRSRSHNPKRRREGDSPVSGDALEKQFKLCHARGAGTKETMTAT